jgi:Protein of unknown function (DUF1566)
MLIIDHYIQLAMKIQNHYRIMFKPLALLLFVLFSWSALNAQQVCNSNMPRNRPDNRYELVTGASPAGSEVRDRVTSLIWKRCVEGMSWSGTNCTGAATAMPWTQALDVARLATATTASPSTPWRVPNYTELFSLPERACESPPINANWFPADPADMVWTSTSNPSAANAAFTVWFVQGQGQDAPKAKSKIVRLVRSSP